MADISLKKYISKLRLGDTWYFFKDREARETMESNEEVIAASLNEMNERVQELEAEISNLKGIVESLNK